jgi:hypothetical protein
MHRTLTAFLLMICLCWQAVACAGAGVLVAGSQEQSHARLLFEGVGHHHDAHDGGIHLDESADSVQHAMSDACVHAPALLAEAPPPLPPIGKDAPIGSMANEAPAAIDRLNIGRVIAGAIGSSRTLQYTVIGDAENLAARLCNVAEIIISPSTMKACEGLIIAEQRVPVQVKGKADAIPIWNVTGTVDMTGVAASAPRSHSVPFRTQEPS